MNVIDFPTDPTEYIERRIRGRNIMRRWWKANKHLFAGCLEYPVTATQADPNQ